MFKSLGFTVLFLLATAGVATAEIATRSNWIPTSSGMGDLWTFSCPAGGNFDLAIDTVAGGTDIDLSFSIIDEDGAFVNGADDDFVCAPASCFGCPRVLASPCALGGTYSIQVRAAGCTTAAGGGYELSLEVRDAAAVAVSAKKAKLGGGPKSKVPAWHSVTTTPAVDDALLN